MGFCLLNNVAVAAAALGGRRASGCWSSTGTCTTATGRRRIFWDDPSVLYVSTHQYPLGGAGRWWKGARPGPSAAGRRPAAAAAPGRGDRGSGGCSGAGFATGTATAVGTAGSGAPPRVWWIGERRDAGAFGGSAAGAGAAVGVGVG